ncbi:RDD family protein [Desulfosediminicola ganghwensis]|uniref:RDD family protein n=1 Tax=Desulfosediminicola ganghwensis TaxID=2569540 RepID=UPI0010AC99BA|nr:RDD family protein [Desulfosediminicola ganghwensis]
MQREICGFWRRAASFFIDILILGLFGILLGLFFSQQFVVLGGWGRIVGFAIAALYFGVLNSRILNGQTVGKKIFGIQVVDENGQLIDIWKSLIRYSIIGVPFFLNGAQISANVLHSVWLYLVAFLVFGVGLSIVYLLVFNRNTRQSLHDFLVGTYVIKIRNAEMSTLKRVWRFHYGVCATLLVTSLCIPILVKHLSQTEFFAELLDVQERVQSLPTVAHASISDGKTTFRPVDGDATLTTYIKCDALLSIDETANEVLAAEIADAILATHTKSSERNVIHVALIYGYDIGISSFWRSNSYSFSPAQWKERIKNTSEYH